MSSELQLLVDRREGGREGRSSRLSARCEETHLCRKGRIRIVGIHTKKLIREKKKRKEENKRTEGRKQEK